MLTKTLSEAKKKQRSILIKAMNNDVGSIDSSKDSWNPAQISERAKDISYIRSLVDSWNPAQLNEALKMLDLPVIDTWNPAQIEEQRRNLVFYLSERTLTGKPITINILGNITPEVTGLKVTMNPIQSGSGTPSPTNIRTISGRTEASVTRTAGEDVETKTHQYSETIYGGVDDFVNGGATSSMKKINAKDYTWAKSGTVIYCNFADVYSEVTPETPTGRKPLYCNILPYNNSSIIPIESIGYGGNPNNKNIVLYSSLFPDLASWNSYITDNDVEICYPLATPTTISTSAEEITLLKGTNVLSTDGDSIELKYKQNF